MPRNRLYAVIAAGTIALTAWTAASGPQAHASGYTFNLVNDAFEPSGGINTSHCMRDPGNAPWQHSDQRLANCDGSQEDQLYGATPSSYGAGWDSVVLGNQAQGNYCLTAVSNSDGANLEPMPCDGSSAQAWKDVCVLSSLGGTLTYPEVENADGYAWNDYGAHDLTGDSIAVWHFESPAPDSLMFMGPELQAGCTGTGGLP